LAARKHSGPSAEGGPDPVRVPSLVHLDGYSGCIAADGLRIAVPYTTAREAKLALAQVSSIITGLDARITVIVPVTVPWELPLSRPLVATDAWLRRLCHRLNVPAAQVQILRVLCRNPRSIWTRALPGFDIVVCGCAPDSAAGKLLAMWNGDAMDVVFVPARPGSWVRRVADALRCACRFRSGDTHME
jgi:hypothetical protein